MQGRLPESDTRPNRGAKQAHDGKGHEFARYGKSGGCVATVHVLIWGDLINVRSRATGAGMRARAKALEYPPDPRGKTPREVRQRTARVDR
jgi:hypothetical protein